MSISIYYSARRPYKLTEAEREKIESLVDDFSVERAHKKYNRWYRKWNWESFCLYSVFDDADVILQGATKLPDSSAKAVWSGVEYWCELLTELRRAIKDADWVVNVDDHEIVWLPKEQMYDYSK